MSMKPERRKIGKLSDVLSDAEELRLLRDLIARHCEYCNDCDWQDIEEHGLTVQSWYEQYPSCRKHEENASCEFARYWDKVRGKYVDDKNRNR